MNGEILIPLVVPTVMFAMVFGIVYIRSRENMAMIERGINPRKDRSTPKPFISLKYGLLLMGAGLGLLLAYLLDEQVLHHGDIVRHLNGQDIPDDTRNPAIYFALIAIFGGLGLFLSYLIEKKWMDKKIGD